VEWGIAVGLLPIYIHEVGGSAFEVGLVATFFAGISTFTHPLWGAYSDKIGKRKVLIVFGMIGLSAIFLLMSLQKNPLILTLIRGSTAVFVGAIVPSSFALVTDLSTKDNIGKNLGILQFFGVAGWGVGPILGGLIADSLGFSILWLFVAAICLVAGVFFFFLGKDPIKLEKQKEKTFLFDIFRDRKTRSRISLMSIAFSIFLLGYALVGPNYNIHLVDGLQFSKTMVGIISFVGTIISAIIQPFVGMASDKYGRKWFFMLGALSLTFGNLVLIFAKDTISVFLSWILINGYNISQLIGSAYVTDVVSEEKKAVALGFFNSIGSVTRSLGAALGGILISTTSIPEILLASSIFPLLSIIIMKFLKE